MLQKVDERPDGSWVCNLDFFARELVATYLSPGASMLVMEGPKVMGQATIEAVFDDVLHDDNVQ